MLDFLKKAFGQSNPVKAVGKPKASVQDDTPKKAVKKEGRGRQGNKLAHRLSVASSGIKVSKYKTDHCKWVRKIKAAA